MTSVMLSNPRGRRGRRRNSWYGQPLRHSWARMYGKARRPKRRKNPGLSFKKNDIINYTKNIFEPMSMAGGISSAIVVYAAPKYFNATDWKDPAVAVGVTVLGSFVTYKYVNKNFGKAFGLVGGTIAVMKGLKWALAKMGMSTALLGNTDGLNDTFGDLGMIMPENLGLAETESSDVLFGDGLEPTFMGA